MPCACCAVASSLGDAHCDDSELLESTECFKVPDLQVEPLRRVLRGCGWDPDIVTAKEVVYLGQRLTLLSGEGWKLRVLNWKDVVSGAW